MLYRFNNFDDDTNLSTRVSTLERRLRNPLDFLGPTGLRGPTGSMGATGPQGIGGSMGGLGHTGPTGAVGSQGIVGPTGYTGENGYTGEQGITGPTGDRGTSGLQGPTGPTGQLTDVIVASSINCTGLSTLASVSNKVVSLGTLTDSNVSANFLQGTIFALQPASEDALTCSISNVPTVHASDSIVYHCQFLILGKTRITQLFVNGTQYDVRILETFTPPVSSGAIINQTISLWFIDQSTTPTFCSTNIESYISVSP